MNNTLLTLTNENGELSVNYQDINPTGTIICFAGTTEPPGWIFCDGAEISKATYANLYSVIGNHFGTPIDASLNFLLPDLRAKLPVGNNASTYSLGNTGGHSAVTLTSNQMPAHSHTGTTNSSGAHSHSVTDPGHVHSHTDAYFAENTGSGTQNNVFGTSAGTDTDNEYYYRPDATTSSAPTGISIGSNGDHTHDFATSETGGGESVNIMPPYLVVNYLIKY